MARQSTASTVHPVVFWWSAGIVGSLLVVGAVASKAVGTWFSTLQAGIVHTFGGLYLLALSALLVLAVAVALSPYGRLRLGPDDSRPSFSTPTWFAMLFSAGMGIGLLFFSVGEPLTHFGSGAAEGAPARAMGLTFFHWGLHPWAVYAVVGLAVAFFGFRRGLPLSIRSALYPLLGERIHGRVGDVVDILAVVSTLFGVATSLGLGAVQINEGLQRVVGAPVSPSAQIVIITVVTAAATASVVSGLDVGVRRLSEANMGMAALLLLFILIAGPTAYLCTSFAENLGSYAMMLPGASLHGPEVPLAQREGWLADWTVFYWAWWIAWAPFVGMFIARISRGRTVREFLLGVLLAPTLAGFVWLTVLGDTALHYDLTADAGIGEAVEHSASAGIFAMLEQLPLASVTAVVATICVALFFVTSSDSASLVVDMIASGGNPDPPLRQRVFWAVLEGVCAATLLLAGGLKALQTAALTSALPFCFVILAMGVALVLGLRRAHARTR